MKSLQEVGSMPTEGFNKQRKHFMLCSLLLIFLKTSGVELSEINFLGNKLDVTNPHYLDIWVLVFWGYYCWRFWGIFSLKITWQHKFSVAVRDSLHNQIYKRELSHGKRLTLQISNDRHKNYIVIISPNSPNVRRESYSNWSSKIIWLKILAFFKLTFLENDFSEYILPYLLGLIAILTVIFVN